MHGVSVHTVALAVVLVVRRLFIFYPHMLAVQRMRRPAAELGPNWLEIMMGRAREDGVAGW